MHDRGMKTHAYCHFFLCIPLSLYDGTHSKTHLQFCLYRELLLQTHTHSRIRKNLQFLKFGLCAQPKSNYGSSSAQYLFYITSQTYKIVEGDYGTLCTSKLIPYSLCFLIINSIICLTSCKPPYSLVIIPSLHRCFWQQNH